MNQQTLVGINEVNHIRSFQDDWNERIRRIEYNRYISDHPENRLTNWQRKQWAKAGYPSDQYKIAKFSRMQKDGSELYIGEVL